MMHKNNAHNIIKHDSIIMLSGSTKCIERSHDCLDSLLFDRFMLSPLPNQPGMVRPACTDNKLPVLASTLFNDNDSTESTATVEELRVHLQASSQSAELSVELLELRGFGITNTLLLDRNLAVSESDEFDVALQWLFSV